jgi:hypothetical protein
MNIKLNEYLTFFNCSYTGFELYTKILFRTSTLLHCSLGNLVIYMALVHVVNISLDLAGS